MKSVFILLGVILLISCSDLKRPEQKNKLELVRADLNLLSENSHRVDSDSISIMMSQIDKVEKRIKNYFQYDTLNIKLIERLDSYKRIQPSLMFVLNGRKIIDSCFSVRIKSLESLETDIENSVGNRAMYNEFLDFEKDQVKQLSDFVKLCDSTSEESLKTFHNLHDSIESFSFKLEEENQEQ